MWRLHLCVLIVSGIRRLLTILVTAVHSTEKVNSRQVDVVFVETSLGPDSVSNDYLQYMLWQFPTNVTGWICSTIVTSSLFKVWISSVAFHYTAKADLSFEAST